MHVSLWYAVAEWYGAGLASCDREVVGSNPARGCCVPTPTQRAIPPGSVNEYQRKLGSKRAYHVMHQPRIRGLAASAGVRLRANKWRSAPLHWPLRLGKGLYFFTIERSINLYTPELLKSKN